jgi:hypothetical protein
LIVAEQALVLQEVIDEYFPDRSSLVRNALMCALTDTELLVQRGAMELIINHFRLDHGYGWRHAQQRREATTVVDCFALTHMFYLDQ